MGRPESPIERDGTPIREFAFWLRDLRSRSGLTYSQIASGSHYATTTMQNAANGQRLPTLGVLRAFVSGCGGDLSLWEEYWTQIRRLADPHMPADISRSVKPPWIEQARPGPGKAGRLDAADGWYVDTLTVLLRLDTDPIEAVERRVIFATVDQLSELVTSISVPRDSDDVSESHRLDVELLQGGSLERREQPFESLFRNVIALPKPLRAGDRHEYSLRFRIPAGQPMAPHYVHVPLQRSDHFDLRVRFMPGRPPLRVWKLSGVPTAVIYEKDPAAEIVTPDRFGEVHVTFRSLRQGLTYGLRWQD